MSQKIKIIYAGFDHSTLELLVDSNFSVCGVSYIHNFSIFTPNPADFLFKFLYNSKLKNKKGISIGLAFWIWRSIATLSSKTFWTYKDYLTIIYKNKIPVLDFDREKELINFIGNNQISILIINGWPMLSKDIICAPRFGSLNVHPSKLPKYRGALPTLWALKNTDSETAVTYMLIDAKMDTGKILNQHKISLCSKDDWFTVEQKVRKTIKKTLIRDISLYINGELAPQEQNNETASYTKKYEEYRKINWREEEAKDIFNKINLYPFVEPGVYCYTVYDTTKMFLMGASISETNNMEQNKNGFFKREGLAVYIKANNGTIRFRLFKDLPLRQSLRLLFSSTGNFN